MGGGTLFSKESNDMPNTSLIPNYLISQLPSLIINLGITECTLIGSLGFEERSLAAAKLLAEKGVNTSPIFYAAQSGDNNNQRHIERKLKFEANRKILLDLFKSPSIVECNIHYPNETINKIKVILEKVSKNVILDFSTMPKIIFFPLFKALYDLNALSLFCVYTIPNEYASGKLSYGTSEPRILPGFGGKDTKYDSADIWIPILGFESNIAEMIVNWGNFKKIFPIIAFPGYRAHYVDRVFLANANLLSLPAIERIYYSSANNPFATANLINRIALRQDMHNIVLTPMGPKPHSLGVCIAAIRNNLRVVYSQPWDYNPDYSSGTGIINAYGIRYKGINA